MEEDRQLKKKTVFSTISLFFQSGYSAVLGLVANLILTILLSPAVFGIYITLLSLISILNYFSDIGLAASLIQKKEIDQNDIRTTFTVQQILILSVICLGFLATGHIINFYQLPPEGKYLYWSLLISFFLSSLKTIPSVFLERKIQFQKIVIVQIIENTGFYLTVSVMAILGYKLSSFTIAVFIRSIIGLVSIYSLSFWRPQIGLSLTSLKNLLSFGLPFQASSFLALFKDDLITLFLGKALGFEALGYIGWAKKWAEAPIRIIMDNISRVLFPVLARLQQDKKKIGRVLEKIIDYQTTALAPLVWGLALLMPAIVNLIPKYQKWQPALPFFYLFCLASVFSSYSSPFINLFNALGRVKISFVFMTGWTIAIWLSTVILTRLIGVYGFPITHVVISSTFILVVWQAKKIISFNFGRSIYKPLTSAFLMAFVVWFISSSLSQTWFSFFLSLVCGGVSYFLILKLFFKINLVDKFKALFKYE